MTDGVSAWNRPSAHASQEEDALVGADWPAAHSRQTCTVAEFWPWYLPDAQSAHGVDASAAIRPLVHSWQAFTVATSFSCDRPAAHDAHGVVASVAYCPLPQDEQACTVAEACGWY